MKSEEEMDFDEPNCQPEQERAEELNDLIEQDNFNFGSKATTMEIKWDGFSVNKFDEKQDDEEDRQS